LGGSAYGAVSKEDAFGAIEAYCECGGNFIDTAHSYGDSEEYIGQMLGQMGNRDEIVVATKTPAGRNQETIPQIRVHCEESLRRLKTDRIDLYYIHSPPDDPETMQRTIEEFETLKAEGKILSIGASIKGPAVNQSTVDLCRQYIDSGRIDAIQLIFSIFRQKNADIFDYAQVNGVAIIARTVLENGFLAGKYRRGHEFTGHRRRWRGATLERVHDGLEEAESLAVASPYDTIAHAALRFPLEFPAVTSIIPGAKNAGQTRQNMEIDKLPPPLPEIVVQLKKGFGSRTADFNPGG